jgi:hypothetical protein
MLSTHPGERTSAPQTGFRPDLLPSGLYRRLRSFTGSWGLQAFFALSADCTGYLSYPLACRSAFPDAMRWIERFGPPLAGFTADWELERRAFKSFPHPAPKVGDLPRSS